MKKALLSVLLPCLCLTLVPVARPTPSRQTKMAVRKSISFKDKCARIKLGMTEKEVTAIIGYEGHWIRKPSAPVPAWTNEPEHPFWKLAVKEWCGEDKGVQVCFDKDAVVEFGVVNHPPQTWRPTPPPPPPPRPPGFVEHPRC